MKYVTSSLTAVAALGLAGVSSQANASTVTVDFNYAFLTNSDVTLDGVTPFEMSTTTSPIKVQENFGTLSGGYIASTGADGTNTIDPSLSYAPASVVIGIQPVMTTAPKQEGTGYVNLAFDASGQTVYGFATLDGAGGLASITYAAIPEPSTWALLIAGAGALGFAAHRRRRRQGVALAA